MRHIKKKWWIWIALTLLLALVVVYFLWRYIHLIRQYSLFLYYFIDPKWWPWIGITFLIGMGLIFFVRAKLARPLDVAAKDRRHATQFTITDFLCLFVLVQVPTALIHSIKSISGVQGQEWALFVLDGYAWISIALIWWKSAQIMSRAGVNTPWHRIVLLLVVLPAAVIGPLLPIVFVIVTAIGMVRFETLWGMAFAALCIALAIPFAMALCIRLVHRIVEASEAVTEETVELAEEPQ